MSLEHIIPRWKNLIQINSIGLLDIYIYYRVRIVFLVELSEGRFEHKTVSMLIKDTIFPFPLDYEKLTEGYGNILTPANEDEVKQKMNSNYRYFQELYDNAMKAFDTQKLIWQESDGWQEGVEYLRVDCQRCIWQTLYIHKDFYDQFNFLNQDQFHYE